MVDKNGLDESGGRRKRLVIDFRKLNEKTISDKYPLPSIELILANLGKAKYFTTQDLKFSYHSIFLAEQDCENTSFSVNGGKNEFCHLPFGLKNAGRIFQMEIDGALRGDRCYYLFRKRKRACQSH